jgi:hypothetical protein
MPRKAPPGLALRSIRTSFADLARSFARLEPLLASAMPTKAGPSTSRRARPRRRPPLSPQRRRDLKLRGDYVGMLRGLCARKRAKVKNICARRRSGRRSRRRRGW